MSATSQSQNDRENEKIQVHGGGGKDADYEWSGISLSTARTSSGERCLSVHLNNSNDFVAKACVDEETFQNRGLPLRTWANDHELVEFQYVPGYVDTGESAQTVKEVAPGLVSVETSDGDGRSVDSLTLPTDDGSPFTLFQFSE